MLFIFFLILFSLLNPVSVSAITDSKSVKISALVGTKANIYGYCAPNSKVELKAVNANATTFSNKFGYFQFYRIYLPPIASEICFYLTDTTNRTAPPACIPAPPPNDFTNTIGPIVLPPTIAINSDIIQPNQTISSGGESIPNTPIQIHFFTEKENIIFPKAVNAYSLPVLEIMSDKNGQFNFNLPTAFSTSYKIFASTHHPDLGPSPVSNTLNFFLPSLFYIIWQTYQAILIPLIFLLLTLPLFIYALIKSKQLPPQPSWPALYPKTLAITNCPIK